MSEDKYYLSPRTAAEVRQTIKNTFDYQNFLSGETFGGIIWKGDSHAVTMKSWRLPGNVFVEMTIGVCKIDSNDKMSDFTMLSSLGSISLKDPNNLDPKIKDVEFIEAMLQYAMKIVKDKEEAENES